MLDYFDVLADLHRSRRPLTYLEIGVDRGDAFRLAAPDTLCVGVDPEPRLAADDDLRHHIEVMTSDEFFAGPRPVELFADQTIDMAFIDGLHLFEYALRDFFNTEALAAPESLIVLHDCLPKDAATAARERTTDHWTGDVWKLALCLLDRRRDLELSIIDVPPSGLCLVRGLNPADHTLKDDYESIVAKYQGLAFEEWENRRPEVMRRTTDNAESRLWSARRALDAAQDRLARVTAERAALEEQLSASETKNAGLQGSVADLERQLRSVADSTSWRLTAPLRRLGSTMKRGD